MEIEALEPTTVVDETTPTSETPAAPESAAPSAPADEAAITEPAAATSARSRGPDGRFIKADGTQASEAEHAALVAATPASPPVVPVAQPPQPVVATPEPFVFRADGQRIPIPGSSVSSEGALTIPADQVPAIRQLLAEGVSHRGSWRQKEAEYQRQVTESSAVERARGDKYNKAAVTMLETIESPEWQNEFTTDPQRALFYLKRELGIMLKESDLDAPRAKEAPKVDEAVQQQQLETAARETLTEYLEELLDTPQAKAIYATPAERQAALTRYTRRMAAYYVEKDGQLQLHENAVDDDFNEDLKTRQAVKQAASDAQKAHAFNAKRNVPPVTAPPVVSTKGPSASGSGSRPKFASKEEYNKAMGLH